MIKTFVVGLKNRKYYYPKDYKELGLRYCYKISETFLTRNQALAVLSEQLTIKNELLRSEMNSNSRIIRKTRLELSEEPVKKIESGYKMESYNLEWEL